MAVLKFYDLIFCNDFNFVYMLKNKSDGLEKVFLPFEYFPLSLSLLYKEFIRITIEMGCSNSI